VNSALKFFVRFVLGAPVWALVGVMFCAVHVIPCLMSVLGYIITGEWENPLKEEHSGYECY
jgi:DNA mismatch repair protein MutH